VTRRIGAGTGAISRMSAHVPPRPEPHPEPPPSPLPIPQPHPLPEPPKPPPLPPTPIARAAGSQSRVARRSPRTRRLLRVAALPELHSFGIAVVLKGAVEATPPDIVLLRAEWPERALLRAQLLEEGYDVVATDAWPIPRQYLRSGMKPRLLIVDLQGLPEPREVLEEVGGVMPRERVLVITALGTMTADEVVRLGFRVAKRPISVGDIVRAATEVLGRATST